MEATELLVHSCRNMKWLLLLLLFGCSASQQIATSATAVREYAATIKDKSAQIQAQSTNEAITKSAIEISSTTDKIILEVADIQSSIPNIADITPWWATLLKWGFITVAIIAATFLLIQSGALTAFRLLIGWIPRKTQTEAQIAVNALDPQKDDNVTTWIAAKRASDPLFNAAWLKAKSE